MRMCPGKEAKEPVLIQGLPLLSGKPQARTFLSGSLFSCLKSKGVALCDLWAQHHSVGTTQTRLQALVTVKGGGKVALIVYTIHPSLDTSRTSRPQSNTLDSVCFMDGAHAFGGRADVHLLVHSDSC